MASSDQQGADTNPFGYNFNVQEASLNPPGPPLLDNGESTYMDTFFSDPDSFNAGPIPNFPESSLVPDSDSKFDDHFFDHNTNWQQYLQPPFDYSALAHEQQASHHLRHPDSDLSQYKDNAHAFQESEPYGSPGYHKGATGSASAVGALDPRVPGTAGSSATAHAPAPVSIGAYEAEVLKRAGIDPHGSGAPQEVLAAAATISAFVRNQKSEAAASGSMSRQQPVQSASVGPQAWHGRHQGSVSEVPVPSVHSDILSAQQYPLGLNGHYDSNGLQPQYQPLNGQQQPLPRQPMYRFGTDQNFSQNGYTGPYRESDYDPHKDFARTMSRAAGGLDSAASSLPQSPVLNRHDYHFSYHHTYPQPMQPAQDKVQHVQKLGRSIEQESQVQQPNAKRRRSTKTSRLSQGNAALSASSASPPSNYNNTQSEDNNVAIADDDDVSADESGSDSAGGSGSLKRHRSSAARRRKDSSAAAAARKNLSEAQKRENHIKSEQKRRDIIKDGYKQLQEMVPSLQQGGFSKSAILIETIKELAANKAGNEAVESFLANIENDRLGGAGPGAGPFGYSGTA